jgi:hypothetical protein
MLAERGRDLDVEVVERNDAIEFARPREIADGANDLIDRCVGLATANFGEGVARPFRACSRKRSPLK